MISFSDIITVGFTFIFSAFFENALHKASHYKQSGALYRWHKVHHKDYPAKRLESDTYIDSTGWMNNMYAFYILLTQGIIYCISSNRVFIIFYIQSTSYAIFLEYMHEQFHLTNSWWSKYEWFQYLKQNHLRHHIKHNKNYSFFTTKIDKLNNTYIK